MSASGAFPTDLPAGGIEWPLLVFYLGMSFTAAFAMYYGIGGLFEVLYYRRRRAQAEEWKCQPRRWLSPEMKRYQLKLGTANLAMGSAASGVFAYSVATGAIRTLSFDTSASGVALGVASTLAYFLVTDAGLYWAHRTFHRPLLFRHIHRYHHRVTSPTAITAMAMHPVEFITYQSIMILPLFFVPLWGYGVIFTLLYQNWVALVDHSGIKLYAWSPWQPPSLFHDDHHLYFHVNYGQNMGVWDHLFGTYRREGRRYGADVFGGRGAPIDGASERYVDYSRKASAVTARAEG